MQDLTEEGRKRPLYLLLVLMGLRAFIEAYWRARHLPEAAAVAWDLALAVLSSYTAFVWFCRDSDARQYRRSLLRNIGFNVFALVFVPYYMVRSRAAGQKWRALRRLAGFCFLMLTAAATGMMLASLATLLV